MSTKLLLEISKAIDFEGLKSEVISEHSGTSSNSFFRVNVFSHRLLRRIPHSFVLKQYFSKLLSDYRFIYFILNGMKR